MAKEFTKDNLAEIEEIISHFPSKKAALLPVLRVAEEQFGYNDEETCKLISKVLDLSPAYIYGVLSFYTHYNREWHGKYRIMVCSTLMCALKKSKEIVEHLKKKLSIEVGERTSDGKFSLEKVECLASCGTAPVIQINDVFYENLTVQKVDEILDNLK
ncbi:MAG: NAD(P)H-dependent oxidoreductase subunit E [Spirochaetota bacterium]|nr:NAD(P)H-dependent oxidoreductase subunit E [Spirochaetota bacterium]